MSAQASTKPASTLIFAKLLYGKRAYPISPNQTKPLPTQFDFDNPIACGKMIAAIMSNASGGHMLRDIRLRVNFERRTANLSGQGVHVFYKAEDMPPLLSVDEVLSAERDVTEFRLGNVSSDQYGDGWKRAKWDHSGLSGW